MYRKIIRSRHLRIQILRFVLIGIVATCIHIIMVILLNERFGFPPLSANFTAFLTAWSWSYFGNYLWAFKAKTRHQDSAPKFILASLIGLGLSQLLMWICTEVFEMPVRLALLPIVIMVPMMSFLMNKFWVFTEVPAKILGDGQ